MRNLLVLFAFTFILYGCASYDYKNGTISTEQIARIPVRYNLTIEKQYQTKNYTCATVSLMMAIQYVKHENQTYSEDEIWGMSGTRIEDVRKRGNDMMGLANICDVLSVKHQYLNKMNINLVEYFISNGNPVVLNIRPDPEEKYTHAVLAVGYDKEKQEININDPSGLVSRYSYSDLLARWNAYLFKPNGMSVNSGFVVIHG